MFNLGNLRDLNEKDIFYYLWRLTSQQIMCEWFLKAPSNQQNITVQNLTQNEQDFLPLSSIYNLVIWVNSSTGLSLPALALLKMLSI